METEMLQQISPIGLRHTFPQLLKVSGGYIAVSHLSLGCPCREKKNKKQNKTCLQEGYDLFLRQSISHDWSAKKV